MQLATAATMEASNTLVHRPATREQRQHQATEHRARRIHGDGVDPDLRRLAGVSEDQRQPVGEETHRRAHADERRHSSAVPVALPSENRSRRRLRGPLRLR